MARPKGTPNRRSQILLRELEKQHNFKVVKKIVKLFNETEQLYEPLLGKVLENLAEERPMDYGLNEEEVEMFNKTRKDLWTILSKLMSYCYPKLKTLEVAAGDGDKINFNINVPAAVVSGRGTKDVSVDLDDVKLDFE